MTRTERLLRLARLRGDRAAELILERQAQREFIRSAFLLHDTIARMRGEWTEAELRAAWGDR